MKKKGEKLPDDELYHIYIYDICICIVILMFVQVLTI